MAGEDAARGGARGGARGRGAPRGRARGGRARRGGAAAPPADMGASDVQMTDAPANAQPEASIPQPSTTPSTPASLASRAAPARGGPSSTSARGGAAAGRFLPRAIRRSQLDRETIAAQETAKQETKAAVDARLQRAARGGRGGGRRARGGPPTGFDRIIRGGAGGFGSTIQASSNRESLSIPVSFVSHTLRSADANMNQALLLVLLAAYTTPPPQVAAAPAGQAAA